eukprot:m.55828 g.55828  ORF g.55828 m.55828 type:complete len:490 (-) comp11992_c0_seq1:563-2032(-)
MDHDDDDEKTAESQKQAMHAAHEGRLVQLARHEAFERGERVDFKNHQGTSHFEVENPAVYSRPKTTRLKFMDRYRFFDAVADSEGELVQELLANGIDVNMRNEDGLTALHQCCIDNNLKMAAILLQQPGIDVNIQDCDWWTPLHAAAACGHWRLTNTLLSHGADATIVNSDGELAYDIAEGDRTKGILNDEMARLGMDEAKMTELRDAAGKKMLAQINDLIAQGADLNAKDIFGNTLLHCAASNGFLECIETLLQNKADPDTRDDDQNTPLHLAVFFGELHAVEMLGKYGATLEVRNRHLETPNMMSEDPMMMRLLLALKSKQLSAELLAAAPRGRTHTAAKRRSTATKKDMQKMDLAAEFQKFSHYDAHAEHAAPPPAGAPQAPTPFRPAAPLPAHAAAAVTASSGEDVYSMPRTAEKKTATELIAASGAPVNPDTDNITSSHPKMASHKGQRKSSQAAIALSPAELAELENASKDKKKKKKGGCVVS